MGLLAYANPFSVITMTARALASRIYTTYATAYAAAHAVEAPAQKYSEENKRRVMVGHAAILKVSAQEVTEPAQAA